MILSDKFASGRFLLPLAAGAVFVYCAVTKSMSGEIAAIVTMVFTLYFTRSDRNNGKVK